MSKQRVADFVENLDPDNMKAECEAEMNYLREKYSTIDSVKTALTPYRNALREIPEKRIAIHLMRQSREELQEANRQYRQKVKQRGRRVRKITDVDGYLIYSESLLNATSYIDRLLGLAALTGRRTSELLCSAELERVDDYSAIFRGQMKAKTRGKGPYRIPLLSDFDTVNGALLELQSGKPELWGEPVKAKNRTTKPISQRMRALDFKKYLGDDIIGRDLRRAYVAIAYYQAGFDEDDADVETTPHIFASDVLGHGDDDVSTAASYTDFVVREK